MDTLLEQLVQSPRLPQYLTEMQHVLAEEQHRREQFREQMDEGVKQEFINGKVVVSSPVRSKHDEASTFLCSLLVSFVALGDRGRVGHEKLLVSMTRNDYEPDVCFWGPEKAAKFVPDQSVFPPPDFIVEVLSETTESRDRGVKFQDYETHGVSEYWIVDASNQVIEQYVLDGDVYRLNLKASGHQTIRSVTVRGFEIPASAIFDRQSYSRALRAVLAM